MTGDADEDLLHFVRPPQFLIDSHQLAILFLDLAHEAFAFRLQVVMLAAWRSIARSSCGSQGLEM